MELGGKNHAREGCVLLLFAAHKSEPDPDIPKDKIAGDAFIVLWFARMNLVKRQGMFTRNLLPGEEDGLQLPMHARFDGDENHEFPHVTSWALSKELHRSPTISPI